MIPRQRCRHWQSGQAYWQRYRSLRTLTGNISCDDERIVRFFEKALQRFHVAGSSRFCYKTVPLARSKSFFSSVLQLANSSHSHPANTLDPTASRSPSQAEYEVRPADDTCSSVLEKDRTGVATPIFRARAAQSKTRSRGYSPLISCIGHG